RGHLPHLHQRPRRHAHAGVRRTAPRRDRSLGAGRVRALAVAGDTACPARKRARGPAGDTHWTSWARDAGQRETLMRHRRALFAALPTAAGPGGGAIALPPQGGAATPVPASAEPRRAPPPASASLPLPAKDATMVRVGGTSNACACTQRIEP